MSVIQRGGYRDVPDCRQQKRHDDVHVHDEAFRKMLRQRYRLTFLIPRRHFSGAEGLPFFMPGAAQIKFPRRNAEEKEKPL
jgi:hypothetical protein